MPFRIMQSTLQSASCGKACSNCPNRAGSKGNCDGHGVCPGYGTRASCPPLIVMAVLECAAIALAAATLPAFGAACRV